MKEQIGVDRLLIDSLFYFYFDITTDDNSEIVLEHLVGKAYSDGTNQGAFNALLIKENDKKNAMICRKSVIDHVKGRLKELPYFANKSNYDAWHKHMCDELIDIYSKNSLNDYFTYGNAQKIINMTMKYLFIFGQLSDTKEDSFTKILENVIQAKDYLHIPIDSYIIDAIWNRTNVRLVLKNGKEYTEKKVYAVPSNYIVPWSKMDNYEEYRRIQEELHAQLGEMPRIDWEMEHWIESAKLRRRNKSTL